jgi:hypothetical protein
MTPGSKVIRLSACILSLLSPCSVRLNHIPFACFSRQFTGRITDRWNKRNSSIGFLSSLFPVPCFVISIRPALRRVQGSPEPCMVQGAIPVPKGRSSLLLCPLNLQSEICNLKWNGRPLRARGSPSRRPRFFHLPSSQRSGLPSSILSSRGRLPPSRLHMTAKQDKKCDFSATYQSGTMLLVSCRFGRGKTRFCESRR